MRSRTIKPDFFMDEDLAACSIPARYLFEGLWLFADREGRFEWKVKRMKAEIFPYDNVKMDGLLAELVSGGFVVSYVVDDVRYGEIPNFRKHQPVHPHEAKSIIPERSESLNVITCNDITRHVITDRTELVSKGTSNSNSKGNSTSTGPDAKNPCGEFGNVLLSQDETERLVERHGPVNVEQAIEILDAWIESKPNGREWFAKKYSSAFSVLNPKTCWVWERLAQAAEKSKPKTKETNVEKIRRLRDGDAGRNLGADGIHRGRVWDVPSNPGEASGLGGTAPRGVAGPTQTRD